VRLAQHEVVGRRLERGAEGSALFVVDEPQPELGVDGRVSGERAGDSEDQVVPRLVLEEMGGCGAEEGAGILELLDDHRSILYLLGNA